jgi:hypothetical protein
VIEDKKTIVERLEEIQKQRKALDDEEDWLDKALTAIRKSELKRSGSDPPYMEGRIAKHILDLLKERGPTPEPELRAILEAGGAEKFKKRGQITTSLKVLRRGGKVVDTPAGLDIGHPTRPVKKPSPFQKKKSNE